MSERQIIVTGASRGIGAAIAEELVRKGFDVVAVSRSGEAPAGVGMACDVSNEASLVHAIATAAQRGPIVGIVNNAGAHTSKPGRELTSSEFEQTMHLNATAVLVACREVYPHLVDAGGGLIVNIGSFFDKLAVAENLSYCASKAAVGAITRCLAAEWAQDNIRVLNIAPGYIETGLNREFLAKDKVRSWLAKRVPVGRAGQPEEVARLVGLLFSEAIGFLTGETIYIDGAQGVNL
jgi:NAD(P)-dependent dehydrogenase (short-subunit alcohol dehydrogenase family)